MLAQPRLIWCPIKRVRPLPASAKLLQFKAIPRLASSCRLFTQSHVLLHRKKKKSPSFTPSPEQRKVVNLCQVQNVVVSARPGSGKTATAEAIVAAYPDKRVVLLTFSKTLQLETQKRLNKKYSNCKVLTFHGMAGKLFGVVVKDDRALREQREKMYKRNQLPQWNSESFDITILDEIQDCSELLFWLTICFIQANQRARGGQPARLVVLGDERQAIYGHRGADSRFLTLAPKLFGPISPYSFVNVPLSESFRLSKQSVQFINQVFLGGEPYISSSKTGPKPIVLRCNPFLTRSLAKELIPLIRKYGASNAAIIAPSAMKEGPHKGLANILVEHHRVPISEPLDDETRPDEKVIAGKLRVSTIHQFKGSERNLVILFDADDSFFQFFGRNLPNDRCPNEIFVALTRAAEQLVLIHDDSKKPMPFVSVEAMYETADIINLTGNEAEISVPDKPSRPLTFGLSLPGKARVRDMTRHMQGEVIDNIVSRETSILQLSPPLPDVEHIRIRNVVSSDPVKNFYEAVSDINGLVVTAAFEHSLTGTLKTLHLGDAFPEITSFNPKENIAWLCREACEYQARCSGYEARKVQMRNHAYDWIKPEDLALASSRLYEQFGDVDAQLEFEKPCGGDLHIDDQTVHISGRADIVIGSSTSDEGIDVVWEIKFVSQLSTEHIIQACAYAYLMTPPNAELPRIILFNVRDGEKLEVTLRNGRQGLQSMLESVFRSKYTAKEEMSDDEFLAMCEEIRLEVMNLRGPQQRDAEPLT